MLSQTAEYALRATVHLARHGSEDSPIGAEAIADALGVPRNYLSKILYALAREGLLVSTRGPRGGFRLAEPADRLVLGRIVGVFDADLLREERRCLMGRSTCADENPCPAHERWRGVALAVRGFFASTTLADLAASAERTGTEGGNEVTRRAS